MQFLEDIVREHVDVIGDKEENLVNFYSEEVKTIHYLKKNGVIAYTEHDKYYFIWFVYIGNSIDNAKIVYNTAKYLSSKKPVLYSGTRDYYGNNSIKLDENLYQIVFKEK